MIDTIDTGSMQFGASISRISLYVLLHRQNVNIFKTYELILEKASTNCMGAIVNEAQSYVNKMLDGSTYPG